MSVWLTIPSKRPPEEAEKVLKLWRERGYKIALFCDSIEDGRAKQADYCCASEYLGYAASVNMLIADIIGRGPTFPASDHGAEWFIAAGDDVEPDLNHSAQDIADQCGEHFDSECEYNFPVRIVGEGKYQRVEAFTLGTHEALRTFGVMQPTGDRWGDAQGAYIDRVCGSAWIGREFARRMYQGNGPLFPGYRHMFVDQELQEVAIKMGVLWQRPDLIQLHRHWGRPQGDEKLGNRDRMPEFLAEANSPAAWKEAKELFESRKAAGFPGSEPL